MESHTPNENTELKTFIASLRSGNLIKLIESNQSHLQEKCISMCAKVRQSNEEITRQELILQQNSHLIEKFQNQLQEMSKQYSELFEQQQILQEENLNLKNQLQCSEDKFAELDIIYDKEASALTERVIELETQISQMNDMQSESNNHFNETQSDLRKQLEEIEEANRDLRDQLKYVEDRVENEKIGLTLQINKANEINDNLTQRIIDYEENIKDLEYDLAAALDENKQIIELKKKIEKLNSDREGEKKDYSNEKAQLIAANENMKALADDLKKKLLTKEKEVEEIYLKFKQITSFGAPAPRNPPSLQSNKYPTRKRSSSDDPKPIESSSDSDGSSISFYKMPKRRISTESDNENRFNGFNVEMNPMPKVPANNFRTNAPPSTANKKRSYQKFKHIEIPESPVVSSSAMAK